MEGVLSKTWRAETWANMQPWQRAAVDTIGPSLCGAATWIGLSMLTGHSVGPALAGIAVGTVLRGRRQWVRHTRG